MEFQSLQTLSLSSFVHDALIIGGLCVALLAGLVFINLGVLLPGLLSSLGGRQGDPCGTYVEFGPAAAPLISEPAPRQEGFPVTRLEPSTVMRPHLWRHVSGCGATLLASPVDGGTQ